MNSILKSLFVVLLVGGISGYGIYTLLREPDVRARGEQGTVSEEGSVQEVERPGGREKPSPVSVRGVDEASGANEGAPQDSVQQTMAVRALLDFDEAAAIRGNVVDFASNPVPGARIAVHVSTDGEGTGQFLGPRVASAVADAEGLFEVRGFMRSGERYALVVRHDEFAPTTLVPLDPLVPGTLSPRVVLVPGARLLGRVVDASGAVVPAAMVFARDATRFLRPESAEELSTPCLPDGRFEFTNLPQGTLEIEARSLDSAPSAPLRLVIHGSSTLTGVVLTLGEARSLAARVVSRADGRPMADQWVVARRVGDGGAARLMTDPVAKTDAAGFARMDRVPDGLYALTLRDVPQRLVQAVNATAGPVPENPDEWPLIRAHIASGVSGVVVDQNTGEPIPRYTITAKPVGLRGGGARLGSQLVEDPDGRFLLLGVGDDPSMSGGPGLERMWELIVDAPGYALHTHGPLRLRSTSSQAGLRVALVRGSVVEGRVHDAHGKPLEGVSVSLLEILPSLPGAEGGAARLAFRQQRSTFIDGSFVFPHVGSGSYRIQADHHLMVSHQGEVFACPADTNVNLGTVTLSEGVAIAGVVLDADGSTDPSALVLLSAPGGVRQTQGVNREGRFQFDRLTPGQYELRVIERRGVAVAALEDAITVSARSGSTHSPITLKEGRH
jgi:hypothetical protein